MKTFAPIAVCVLLFASCSSPWSKTTDTPPVTQPWPNPVGPSEPLPTESGNQTGGALEKPASSWSLAKPKEVPGENLAATGTVEDEEVQEAMKEIDAIFEWIDGESGSGKSATNGK